MSDESYEIAELIDRYVSGKLKGEEKAMFETNMAIDTNLFEAVEKQKVIHSMLIESGLNDIRQLMKDDFKKENQFQKTKWIGGSLLLLAITGIGLYVTSNFSTDQKSENIVFVKDSSTNSNAVPSGYISAPSQKEMRLGQKETTPTVTSIQGKTFLNESIRKDVILATDIEVKEENQLTTNAKMETNTYGKDNSVIEAVNPCVEFKPNYSVRTTPSVVHKETGKLTVTSADKSLTYTLTNGKTSFSSTFEELSPGTYTLLIRNTDGCLVKDESIRITQTYCLVIEKEKFSPEIEQEYKFPIVFDDVVSIKIVNKQMQEIRFLNSNVESWDGRNKEGQLVETGLYKIEVLYNNGERCLFNLTVFN